MSQDHEPLDEASEEKPRPTSCRHLVGRLALNAAELGRLLGAGRRSVDEWDRYGMVPKPFHIGRKKLWSMREIQAWISCGCKPRLEWEAIKQARRAAKSTSKPHPRVSTNGRNGHH